jgi:hypothetical protein
VKRALAVAMLLTAFASTAGAEERRVAREWYGYYNLSADTAAFGALAYGLSRPYDNDAGEGLAWTSLFIYGAGGPIIHWAHGNVGTGFASMGMRVGGPIVLAFAGCALDSNKSEFGCLAGGALGALLGVVGAVVVDASVLAYKETELPPARYGIRFMPTGSIAKERATFGIAAVF